MWLFARLWDSVRSSGGTVQDKTSNTQHLLRQAWPISSQQDTLTFKVYALPWGLVV